MSKRKGKGSRRGAAEQPKNQVEMMADTKDVVTGYALANKLSTETACLLLIFNELRCIHDHLHMDMARREKKAEG